MVTSARQRSLILPREHGAWGILLVPLLTGAALGLTAGGHAMGLVPFTTVALALFWLRTPVESWVGSAPIRARTPEEFRLVRKAALILAGISLSGLGGLFWGGRNLGLLWIGVAAGVAFLTQALLKWIWRNARTAAQMIGAAGLTSTGPAAYYVVTGDLDRVAWSLWVANLVFAANQIQFVQLRIHSARAADRGQKLSAGRWFLAGQLLTIVLLAAVCTGGYFGWFAAAAFIPILFRGFAWFMAEPRPLAVQALGKSELLYAAVFGVVLVVGMRQA